MADPESTTRVEKNPSHGADAAKAEAKAETTAQGALSYVGWVTNNAEQTNEPAGGDGPTLSVRSTRKDPPNPVMAKLGEMMQNLYRDDNPEGIIPLGVAENSLMAKDLAQFYRLAFPRFFREQDLTYGDSMFASQRLIKALVKMYTHYLHPHYPLEASHIAAGSGVYSTLNHLLHALINPGEGILISAPYYLGFDAMCTKRCGGVLVGVPMDIDEDGWETEGDVEQRMERALADSRSKGIHVKVIIVTNPGNPIGRTLDRETLLAYCRFAEKHNLHAVYDEIYALSVFDNPNVPNAVPYTSILNIDVERELGPTYSKKRLHVLHGMSKDFCSNGLRVGILISQHNLECVRAVMSIALFMKISSAADTLFYAILSSPAPALASHETDSVKISEAIQSACESTDPLSPVDISESFGSWFIAENRRRLTESAAYMTRWFTDRGFRVYPANAGHFLWVDFGDRLGWDTWEKELDGFNGIFAEKVYIGPGSVFHSCKPGKMRVTFTVSRDLMDKGLARLDHYLSSLL